MFGRNRQQSPPQLEPVELDVPQYGIFMSDRSGSMSGDKHEESKKAEKQSVDDLDASTTAIAYVPFGSYTGLWHDFTTDHQRIKRAIDQVSARNGTPFWSGLEWCRHAHSRVNGHRFILISSDGLPTDLDKTPQDSIRLADQLKQAGIRIATIAIGRDADRDFLERIASSSDLMVDAPSADEITAAYSKATAKIKLAG